MTLSYEVGAVYHPRLPVRSPRLIAVVVAVLVYVAGGIVALLAPFAPLSTALGTILISLGVLGFLLGALVFAPPATWLCVGRTGVSYSFLFWRRHLPWSLIKELRLVGCGWNYIFVEVVPVASAVRPYAKWWRSSLQEPGSMAVHAELFGRSPAELVQEMDEWRARNTDE